MPHLKQTMSLVQSFLKCPSFRQRKHLPSMSGGTSRLTGSRALEGGAASRLSRRLRHISLREGRGRMKGSTGRDSPSAVAVAAPEESASAELPESPRPETTGLSACPGNADETDCGLDAIEREWPPGLEWPLAGKGVDTGTGAAHGGEGAGERGSKGGIVAWKRQSMVGAHQRDFEGLLFLCNCALAQRDMIVIYQINFPL